jgi:tetratricopeptide (TPR) repeat protein
LRTSTKLLSSLNLKVGAKWSAEALVSIPPQGKPHIQPTDHPVWLEFESLDAMEMDKLTLGNTYFDCKEFDRCAFLLRQCSSPFAAFMRFHSMFISGDKKREEDSEGILGTNDSNVGNASVPVILKELSGLMDSDQLSTNPFLLYLYGSLLIKQKNMRLGINSLVKSIKIYPYNWDAWLELTNAMSTLEEAIIIWDQLIHHFANDFCSSIMVRLSKVVISQQFFQQSEELFKELDYLLTIFPTFPFLKTQRALISYHAFEYNEAEQIFDEILENDPLCLDDMDTYSNILYVMEKRAKLSYLAQLASSVDKFRPETCCIIANYYSLKFEHEKAIMYYRRALTLNRNCLSAWTLMGHEFVECKNSHAAIESYRRAVDTNSKDFKAWYGLGQAYEVLDMHLYSLYYYQQACVLKPMDKRIWQALGECYFKLNKIKDSIKSFKKALQLSDFVDLTILLKMATLYESIGELDKVYEHMNAIYTEELNIGQKNDETAKARLWLARYELKMGNYENAYNYAVDLSYGTSQEIEDARSIAREARNRMNK